MTKCELDPLLKNRYAEVTAGKTGKSCTKMRSEVALFHGKKTETKIV